MDSSINYPREQRRANSANVATPRFASHLDSKECLQRLHDISTTVELEHRRNEEIRGKFVPQDFPTEVMQHPNVAGAQCTSLILSRKQMQRDNTLEQKQILQRLHRVEHMMSAAQRSLKYPVFPGTVQGEYLNNETLEIIAKLKEAQNQLLHALHVLDASNRGSALLP